MAVVTDRPKSVRNRCVIEVIGGVFCVVMLLFGFFSRCRGFCPSLLFFAIVITKFLSGRTHNRKDGNQTSVKRCVGIKFHRHTRNTKYIFNILVLLSLYHT